MANEVFQTVDDWIVYLKDNGWISTETGYVPMNKGLQKKPSKNWRHPELNKQFTIEGAVILQRQIEAGSKLVVRCVTCRQGFVCSTKLAKNYCFGCPEPKYKIAPVTVGIHTTVSVEMHQFLKEKASEKQIPVSKLVRLIVEKWRKKQSE